MKKTLTVVLSLLLCFTFLVGVANPALVIKASANNTTIELPEQFQNSFDKFTNLLIDIVNRILMIVRFPWQPLTEKHIDMSKFTLVFEDEFDGDTLNTAVWNCSNGVRKGGYWDKDQTSLRDGNLVIKTSYKEDGKYGAGYYTDRVDTRNKYTQTYGYYECRCILPAAQGMWSAFWLTNEAVSVDGTPGTEGSEIDIFESPFYYRTLTDQNNSMVTSNVHYCGYGLQTKYMNAAIAKAVNPYTEYNTYGLEWNENEYIFYVNGVETGRSKFGGVSKAPEFMILSCEVDGVDGEPYPGWSGVITDNNKGELPAEFVVDYVRTYQYK